MKMEEQEQKTEQNAEPKIEQKAEQPVQQEKPAVEPKPEPRQEAYTESEPEEKQKSNRMGAAKEMLDRIKRFYLECRRVLKVTQKPSKHEALTVIKITALGLLVIGAIGFVIKMAQLLLFKGGL